MNLLTEILCVRLQPDIASVSYVFDFHCPNYTPDSLLKCNEHGLVVKSVSVLHGPREVSGYTGKWIRKLVLSLLLNKR